MSMECQFVFVLHTEIRIFCFLLNQSAGVYPIQYTQSSAMITLTNIFKDLSSAFQACLICTSLDAGGISNNISNLAGRAKSWASSLGTTGLYGCALSRLTVLTPPETWKTVRLKIITILTTRRLLFRRGHVVHGKLRVYHRPVDRVCTHSVLVRANFFSIFHIESNRFILFFSSFKSVLTFHRIDVAGRLAFFAVNKDIYVDHFF